MKKIIAKDLLDIKAVFLRPNEPFTWASGIKSPIYCDNRLTLSYPKVRKDVEQGLAQLVKDNFPDAECLMGTATAGIAHAALAADILDLPMGYVRGGAKSHGRNNRIEGVVKDITDVFISEFPYKKEYLNIIFAGVNDKDLVVIDAIIKRLNQYNIVNKINYKVIKEDQLPIEDFHSEFNKYIYTPTPKNWDCSSRLIRECVTYDKKVLFTRNSLALLDTNYGLKYLIKKFNLL